MRTLAVLVAAGLTAVSALVAPPALADKGKVVTLSTGDRVRVTGHDRLTIKPAPGREKIRFLVNQLGEATQVIPVDQLPAIHAGRLDRDGFTVTGSRAKRVGTQQVHALTLTHLGLDGAPAQIYDTLVINRDTYETTFLHGPPETGTLFLPAGRYVAYTVMFSGDYPDRPEMTMLANPSFTLDGDLSFTFDGRVAGLVSVSVPHPTAKSLFAEAGWEIRISDEIGLGGSMLSDTFERMYTGHAGGGDGDLDFVQKITTQWGDLGASGSFDDIGAVWALAWYPQRFLLNGFKGDVRPEQLARVQARHKSHLAGGHGLRALWPELPGKAQFGLAAELFFTLPFKRVDYVNNDGGRVRWHTEVFDDAAVAFLRPPANFVAGHEYRQAWNNAVFSPGPDGTRTGDTMAFYIPMYTDASGHPGYGVAHTQRTSVTVNGIPWFEAPDFNPQSVILPPEEAVVRLEVAAQRGNPWPYDLSSDVKVAWTFRSRHTDAAQPLPMSVVRFHPLLDEFNTAPAGVRFLLPITVARQAGGASRTPLVEVSYDDGLTWQRVALTGVGTGWIAGLRHPFGIGYVSLRAKHTDSLGNVSEVTVIHAYRFR